jgi:hypothetical protein
MKKDRNGQDREELLWPFVVRYLKDKSFFFFFFAL